MPVEGLPGPNNETSGNEVVAIGEGSPGIIQRCMRLCYINVTILTSIFYRGQMDNRIFQRKLDRLNDCKYSILLEKGTSLADKNSRELATLTSSDLCFEHKLR